MPPKILELRRKVSGSFNNNDSLSYVRTNWAGIDGKPLVYPPEGHTHTIAQVTNLQSTLNGKLNKSGDTMTGPITMGSNNITGNNSSIFQAGRIIATNSNTSAHGITSKGTRANMLYLMEGATGGLAASLLDVDVKNTTTPQKRIAKIGIFGSATSGTGGTPSANYLWLSAVEDNTYNVDATLKVDSQNRIGVAIAGSGRPTQALDVNGKIRMRTSTVDEDNADIVVTKGYMLSKIENNKPSWTDVTDKPIISVSGTTSGTNTDPKAVSEQMLKQVIEAVSPPGSRPASDVAVWAKSGNSSILPGAKLGSNSSLESSDKFLTNAQTFRYLSKADVGLSNVSNVDATNPANISQSSNYRFVTDSEKDTWDGKANNNDVVKLSGAQTISGIKTFNDEIIIPGQNNYIDLGRKSNWFWTRFSGENWSFNNTYTGGGWARNLLEMKDAGGDAYFRIGAQGSSQNFTQMYIGPAYNDYWLSLNNTRALFSAKPQYASNPTTNNDLTRKYYVDTELSTKQDALGYTPVPETRTIAGQSLSSNIGTSALQTALDLGSAAYANISAFKPNSWPSGLESQYVRGDGSLETFPTISQNLELLRSRSGTNSLTSHTFSSVANVGSQLTRGDTIMFEVLHTSTVSTTTPKVITATVGSAANSASHERSITYTTWSGSEQRVYSMSVALISNKLTFGNTNYMRIYKSGSNMVVSNSSWTPYIGRIWKVVGV